MPYNAASARTQFKKGIVPANRKYLGHERTDKDGYVWISVAERNPHTGHARRYVMKHRWLWEKQRGPIPADMVLKCLGDKSNTDPSNWKLIPRSMLPRLAGRWSTPYDGAHPDIKPIILATAELEYRARSAT